MRTGWAEAARETDTALYVVEAPTRCGLGDVDLPLRDGFDTVRGLLAGVLLATLLWLGVIGIALRFL